MSNENTLSKHMIKGLQLALAMKPYGVNYGGPQFPHRNTVDALYRRGLIDKRWSYWAINEAGETALRNES